MTNNIQNENVFSLGSMQISDILLSVSRGPHTGTQTHSLHPRCGRYSTIRPGTRISCLSLLSCVFITVYRKDSMMDDAAADSWRRLLRGLFASYLNLFLCIELWSISTECGCETSTRNKMKHLESSLY